MLVTRNGAGVPEQGPRLSDQGGVFSDDMLDAYCGLKHEELTRFRMTTHRSNSNVLTARKESAKPRPVGSGRESNHEREDGAPSRVFVLFHLNQGCFAYIKAPTRVRGDGSEQAIDRLVFLALGTCGHAQSECTSARRERASTYTNVKRDTVARTAPW